MPCCVRLRIRGAVPEQIRSFPPCNDGTSYRWLEILIDFLQTWGMALFHVALDEGLPEEEKHPGKHLVFLGLLRKMHKVHVRATRIRLWPCFAAHISFQEKVGVSVVS